MRERDRVRAVVPRTTTGREAVDTTIDWNRGPRPNVAGGSLQAGQTPTVRATAPQYRAESLRVLMAVSEPLVARGLRSLVEDSAELRITVSEVNDASSLLEWLISNEADVCVLDQELPGDLPDIGRMVAAVRDRRQDCSVLVLAREPRLDDVLSAVGASAAGVVAHADEVDLLAAIRAAASGLAVLTGHLLETIVGELVPRPDRALADRLPAGIEELTPRELEVLRCMAAGMSNVDIAEQLAVSKSTVKTHVGHVFTKLEARDRAQAVIAAFAAGVVVVPSSGNDQRP